MNIAFKTYLISQPKIIKRAIVLTLDSCSCFFATWVAFGLRFDVWSAPSREMYIVSLVSIVISIPLFIRFGLYRAIFRYTGWRVLLTMGRVVVIYSTLFFGVFTLYSLPNIPRSIGVIQPIIFFIFIGCIRSLIRFLLNDDARNQNSTRKLSILIYGAGYIGRSLAKSLMARSDCIVVGLIDDQKDLHGREIEGVPIYASSQISELFNVQIISDVVLTTDTLGREKRIEIIKNLTPFSVRVRSISSFEGTNESGFGLSQITDLDIDDLLSRDVISPDKNLLHECIEAKVVLITGAGGSIGSEIARQAFLLKPKVLLLIDNSEHALYQINEELKRSNPSLLLESKIIPLLASVCDISRMQTIFATWTPNTVFHAAAYKHVPLVEHNPLEAIKNNILGTHICAELAQTYVANNFVLISTDKAVRPTNIMGATKRFAELILQAYAESESRKLGKTIYSMVRFGNVLGSSGSVVPLFKHQISTNGPITVTDPDVTRYFMSIPEAAQLVIQTSSMALGGEVFVLDMGKSVRIFDLAKRMISLSGLRLKDEMNPNGDIEIVFTGLRPGEKLYEELLIGNSPEQTAHPKIMKAKEDFHEYKTMEGFILEITDCISNGDVVKAISVLKDVVVEFTPHNKVVEWTYLERHH
jgi:FlaA1/EpsC-like NDP-sugar epimerase